MKDWQFAWALRWPEPQISGLSPELLDFGFEGAGLRFLGPSGSILSQASRMNDLGNDSPEEISIQIFRSQKVRWLRLRKTVESGSSSAEICSCLTYQLESNPWYPLLDSDCQHGSLDGWSYFGASAVQLRKHMVVSEVEQNMDSGKSGRQLRVSL